MKKFLGGQVEEYSKDLNHNNIVKWIEFNYFRPDGNHMSRFGNQLIQKTCNLFLQNSQTCYPPKELLGL